LGIYSIKNNEITWLETGDPDDKYLTCVSWGLNEKYIYVAHLNRDQNHLQLIKYEVSTGKRVKILFEETDEEYVEPENSLIFLPNEPNKFLWFSERDNWNHLYLYDIEGNLINQVTKGKWVVTSFSGFDKNHENIFIYSTLDSPIDRNFYRVNLQTGKISQITNEPGIHNVSISPESNYYIDSYSNQSVPRVINILGKHGEFVEELHRAKNPILDYKLGKSEIITLDGKKGYDYYCKLNYPTNFNPNKKYPVIVYVYGGPHAQLVTNSWPFGRYDFWFQYMAQQGYFIFTLDNRGSSNRGLEFEQEIFRQLGTKEIEDQLLGIEYLKTKAFIDSSRIGVYGWSYGGFMTTSLMLKTNNTFKVGVGGGTVTDWKYYEVMYGERYMDTPESNPEGYKESSLLNYVDKLNGKLLLVHGTLDPVVVWQHTLEFAKRAAELNKPLDYYPYVGHEHGVRGKDALHLYNKISQYFINNL
jgi:dipeptidyl-peptidase-4